MKTFKTLLLAGAGLLLAGAANAQVGAPQVTPATPQNYSSLTARGANNAIANTGRNQRDYAESSVVQQLGTNQYASVIQAGVVGAESTADIQQTGSASRSDAYQEQSGSYGSQSRSLRDHAYIYQNGERGIASQRQDGNDNDAVIRQNSGTSNWAFQGQYGNGNNAEANQGGDANFSNQVQRGNGNQARTTQENGYNWATTNQVGTSNTALIYQK